MGTGLMTASMRIGEVAERLGITTRTLRYYEELGLVTPSAHSTGGARRYSDEDFARVARVRELQAVMGFNLDEIRELLHADDRMVQLRSEYRAGTSATRANEIVNEAARLNARTQEQVLAKIAVLQAYHLELVGEAERRRVLAEERGLVISVSTAD